MRSQGGASALGPVRRGPVVSLEVRMSILKTLGFTDAEAGLPVRAESCGERSLHRVRIA